jgi:Tfp pilus assembly protein PilF
MTGQVKSGNIQALVTRLEERLRVLESTEMRDRDKFVRIPAELHLAIGSAYFRQNRLKEAEEAYTAAVQGDARLGAAHNNLAVIYMMTGRYDQAGQAVAAAERSGLRVDPRFKTVLAERAAAARTGTAQAN